MGGGDRTHVLHAFIVRPLTGGGVLVFLWSRETLLGSSMPPRLTCILLDPTPQTFTGQASDRGARRCACLHRCTACSCTRVSSLFIQAHTHTPLRKGGAFLYVCIGKRTFIFCLERNECAANSRTSTVRLQGTPAPLALVFPGTRGRQRHGCGGPSTGRTSRGTRTMLAWRSASSSAS